MKISMFHRFILSASIFSIFGFFASAGTIDTAQRMLNQLGYNAGPVDGAYGGKTRAALERFYAQSGSKFDGNLDANEIADLRKALQESPVKFIPAEINVSDRYRFDNFPGLIHPSYAHSIRKSWFGYTDIPYIDVTDDGHRDLILYSDSPDTGRLGGNIPNNSANLIVAPFVPKWKEFDMFELIESSNTTLVAPFLKYADMNGDKRVDIVVAASALGTDMKTWGTYVFFNQGNGTFKPIRISRSGFTHAHGVGDLDSDGDIDIIYHQLGAKYVKCELNDGRGNFKRTDCLKAPRSLNHGWVQNIWGFRVADFDNDGITDISVFSGLGKVDDAWGSKSKNQLPHPTIFWGDGSLKFSYNNKTELDTSQWVDQAQADRKPYFKASYPGGTYDFGNDGDVDLIASLIGKHSIGGVTIIFENEGGRKFSAKEVHRSKFLKIDPVRFRSMQDKTDRVNNHKNYTAMTEGLVWNNICGNILFIDISGDGIDDFVCGGTGIDETNAVIVDRWNNHQKQERKVMPWMDPRDWKPEWSSKNIFVILDEAGNAKFSGKVFNAEQTDFSDVFKSRGYKIKTLGWRN